ncbi:MAG: hypothetical protein IPM97_06265 [Bdellovibrionaceae bacterium]|nr:hypothetical protein [Pseudobdellovibrionaceae bacterium]
MKKLLMVFFLVSVQSLLVSCAKNDNKTPVAGPGVCAAGQAYTQYGCLPTGYAQCTPGYGYAQQYGCVAPMAGNGAIGGQSCINGQVYTQYGCLQAGYGQCPAGYGYAQQYGCVAPLAGNGAIGGQTCQAGTVGTVMGCLPQNPCPVGYGYYYGVYNGQTGGWCYQQTY